MEPSFGTGVTHTLASGEDATKTITLKWDADAEKWVADREGWKKHDVLATFEVICKASDTYTVRYTDGLGDRKSVV